MSAVGVLPFVRGIDLTSYDFKGGKFPKKTENMSGLQWIKLDKTNLCYLPEELVNLKKLEEISVSNNQLTSLHGDLGALSRLKSIRASRNKLKDASVPQHIFELEDLSVLDLSHNNLTIIPPDLENSKNILVLNLGHNEISSIPVQLFINLSDLLHLDMSNNNLETLPPQMRRLVHLKVLILNNNPLLHAQLRQLPSMVQLTTLHLRNTQRTISNFPSNLSTLRQLADVDLSCNELSRVPDSLYSISTLKRLNLSNNQIDELSLLIDTWTKLETLNLSNNLLTSLPTSICKLQCLRRLFVNDNKLDFEGIPASIGKLANLECFSAASNSIEIVPESLCRCMKLRKLILTNNRLASIPQSIHHLTDLQTLDVRGNSDVEIPPKPTQVDKAKNDTLYNVDFSLKHQLKKLGASADSDANEPSSPSSKDPVTRKMRMKRRREADVKAQQVLKGMTDVAEGKNNTRHDSIDDVDGIDSMKSGKKWNESLNKPDLDYGEIFTAEVGQFPGLTVWQIDNLYPSIIEDMSLYGKFYIGDCYIILNTQMDDSSNLSWEIYFWIGQDASIDKKACSAIHAVNLRNMLGATGRTIREEMNDESDEFLNLFENSVSYIEGGNLSGFYTVEDKVYPTKLYAFYGQRNVTPYPVPLRTSSLNPNEVLLLDNGRIIYVWAGSNTQTVKRSKARLIAEKINKDERKNEADIIIQDQGYEDMEFWQIFGGLPDEIEAEELTVYRHKHPRLYRVNLGMGYLELPQVRYQLATEHDNKITSKNDVHPKSRLLPYLLDTKNVYILDTYTNVYIWVGRKSTRLVRAAAGKLAFEIAAMMDRPSFSSVTKEVEGHETVIFKSNFKGWTDVVKVDYTKSQEPVHLVDMKKGNLSAAEKKDEEKKKKRPTADVQAIFAPRQPPVPFEEAKMMMKDWNDDLEMMQGFVLHGKKFVPLPQEEFGRFYSHDCYVFLCRYWVPADEEDSVDEDASQDEDESTTNDAVHYILYFWQGRDATNMGWLTFTFTLQPKFEKAFPGKLEVLKMKQQQENVKFLSHFKQKFFITNGSRKEARVNQYKDKTQFYQIRSNGSYLTTRCIEIEANPQLLNSQFCYILKVPFNSDDLNGIVYAWIGRIADVNESRLAEELAGSMFSESYSVQIIYEGEEPENFFWVALGGRPLQPYDEDADYLDHSRLFRCSNDKGFFCVSEKCADFCQTDLADDDIMILDNGESVYMWVGTQTSETETQFGLRTTMLYIKHMKSKGLVRKLKLVRKGNEPFEFTRCFHAWYPFPKP